MWILRQARDPSTSVVGPRACESLGPALFPPAFGSPGIRRNLRRRMDCGRYTGKVHSAAVGPVHSRASRRFSGNTCDHHSRGDLGAEGFCRSACVAPGCGRRSGRRVDGTSGPFAAAEWCARSLVGRFCGRSATGKWSAKKAESRWTLPAGGAARILRTQRSSSRDTSSQVTGSARFGTEGLGTRSRLKTLSRAHEGDSDEVDYAIGLESAALSPASGRSSSKRQEGYRKQIAADKTRPCPRCLWAGLGAFRALGGGPNFTGASL